tara:strand:- start:350 stop:958 length:609 start_codon:yes stop_codon:yes gene_type:complete
MSYLILGFFTGLSLILAIGAQNIFVIEQGLKKQYIFLVCLICSISDMLLIFFGVLIFNFFQNYFNIYIELILNILLILFLLNFIWKKLKENTINFEFNLQNQKKSLNTTILKTLGFTYLNPHVYSDTVFFLGNFSKNFSILQKIYFGLGATISSFIFFFAIGYLSNFFSKYLRSSKIWKILNKIIIAFMSFIIFFVVLDLFN